MRTISNKALTNNTSSRKDKVLTKQANAQPLNDNFMSGAELKKRLHTHIDKLFDK